MDIQKPDPRLVPTPDYGTLGPGSDLQSGKPIRPTPNSFRAVAAIAAGVLGALVFVGANSGVVRAAWDQVSQLLTLHGKPEPASPGILSGHETEGLGRQSPQQQSELLLERSINHYEGANDEIASRVDAWRGKLKLTPHMNSLIETGLNSNDLRVRAATIEIDLAALNVAKTPQEVDSLVQRAITGSQQERVWALWTLGLLGNRGVQPDRVYEILVSQIHDPNADVRHWTVEGLAYLGTDNTIEPLLKAFHDDPSPMVRERAACSLAQSGMLNEQQRRSVIPTLLDYAEDSSLDAATHAWTFHALRDITAQNLPDDPAAWRNWYNNSPR